VWAPVLATSAALSLVDVLWNPVGYLPFVMIVLAYPAGRRMASLAVALWLFMSVTVAALALAFWHSPDPGNTWLATVGVQFGASVLPWSVGRYRRLRAEQRDRERHIVAGQARLRERARIARDMHDSLGHELALIALHGGALELAKDLTDQQRLAAGEVRACAVRATTRLHEIVQVLGDTDAAGDLLPADESIDDLVRRSAAAGLPVRLRHDGPAPTWSPMTAQAAHRVVQESLTNATRHAPGAAVTVTVARERIEVVNDAATEEGASGGGSGQGLIGLDERVRLAGGRFSAGPRTGGGWVVTASFPDGARPREDDQPDFELRVSRRQTRRRLRQTAALPVAVGIALIMALVVVQMLTVRRTGLGNAQFDRLRVGQSRAEVERLVPVQDLGPVPRVVTTPPQPVGATCEYYRAGTGLGLGAQVFQLCFAGDVLVSKTRWERA
jgi:signal transduction histidine kinase